MKMTSSVDIKLPDIAVIKKMIQSHHARVGVLGSDTMRKDADSSMTNAEIGLVQQFGSIEKNIPPRDFLIQPVKMHGKQIIETLNKSNLFKTAIDNNATIKAVKLLGVAAESWVKMGFTNAGFGTWAPNAPYTIAKKGSSAPLVDTGQLARSISSDVVK
jgi:hypothetical protein